MKIITEEQYETYLNCLENISNSVNGQYHNNIDAEHEQYFEKGDATNEQIIDDAECFGLETEGKDIEEICEEVCEILKKQLNKIMH